MTRTIAALAAAALMLTAGPSLARDDAALKTAAEAYVGHPVVQQMLDDMWSADTMRSALVAQLKARGAKLRNDQVEALTRIVHEELNRIRPQFEAALTSAVVANYTLGEIRALNRFLNTELGARAMAKTARTMQSFNASSVPMLRSMFERLGARVKTELPK